LLIFDVLGNGDGEATLDTGVVGVTSLSDGTVFPLSLVSSDHSCSMDWWVSHRLTMRFQIHERTLLAVLFATFLAEIAVEARSRLCSDTDSLTNLTSTGGSSADNSSDNLVTSDAGVGSRGRPSIHGKNENRNEVLRQFIDRVDTVDV
jgi:hypothetical protein